MATFPNFNTSNSNEVHDLNFEVLHDYIIMSQQRQTTGNRSNDSATANSLVSSTNLTSQTSHNFYPPLPGMLPTPEGSDNNPVCPETLMLSPYNMLPGSGHLTMEDTYKDEFYFEPLELESPESGVSFIQNYNIPGLLSPQTSPTLPPDSSTNNTSNSPTRRQSNKGRYSPITKQQKVSSNNNDSMLQSRRKSSFTNNTNKNNNNTDNNNGNSVNGQNNATTNLPSIITGSPNKLPSNSIMFSLLELTSPLMNNMVATSTAPSLQEIMPNLNLGSNLVSDVTNTHSSTSILSNESSSSLAPITPSSLMKLKRKPNSPKSNQNELKSNSQQQQQNQQDQIQQLQSSSKEHSTFIAPTPPAQLNQIRTNIIATTGAASPSGASGRKSIRPNPNASSPLALGPSKSPHSLKPTISPNLKPKLPGVLANEVAEQLANKSNYRSILEGTAQSLGISYSSDVHSSLESRRTTHKAAEQKRRDSLKHSFDELKKVVPFQSISSKCNNDGNTNNNSKSNSNGKSGDGTMKNVSKLFLLKRAHDHIVELEQKSKEKDEIIQKLKDELDELKRVKRQKIEETKKEENEVDEIDNEVDTETKQKDEQQTSSNDC